MQLTSLEWQSAMLWCRRPLLCRQSEIEEENGKHERTKSSVYRWRSAITKTKASTPWPSHPSATRGRRLYRRDWPWPQFCTLSYNLDPLPKLKLQVWHHKPCPNTGCGCCKHSQWNSSATPDPLQHTKSPLSQPSREMFCIRPTTQNRRDGKGAFLFCVCHCMAF